MYNRLRKPKSKIILTIILLIIAIMIFTLCVQAFAKNKLINTSIIAGKDIAKNEAIEELDKIDWIQDNGSNIGNITINNNGKTVKMTAGYGMDKNAIYYIPESSENQTFSFSFDLEFGDNFDATGVLFGIQETDNTLQGYILYFKNLEHDISFSGEVLTLGKFTYNLGERYNNTIEITEEKAVITSMEQVAACDGDLTIESTANQIKITGTVNNNSVDETIDITSGNTVGNGVGFCTQMTLPLTGTDSGSFSITGITLSIENIEPYNLYVDPNGGTWDGSSQVSTIEGEYEDEVEIPLPTRPGYNFAGWTQTGNSGTMSTLTEDAIYTFGENSETDDTITAQWTKIEATKEYSIDIENSSGTGNGSNTNTVKEGQQITYKITVTNTGTVDATALIKDMIPEGTTFVDGSIKVNDEDTSYTEEELESGISIPVEKDSSSTLSFKVEINKLTDGDKIDNTAIFKDITISQDLEEKETNNVELIYSQLKHF